MGSIGIFDSGVGGLTVLSAIKTVLPKEEIIYFADQKNVPYAEKSPEFLINRSIQITKFLIDKGCSTIVIACNTATVSVIDTIREQFKNIAIIGVEPAIKPAASHAQEKGILILATKHTLQSQRLNQLINQTVIGQKVVKKDMPEWVQIAESDMGNPSVIREQIMDSLSQFNPQEFDSIVLACTHYPIFKPYIQSKFPHAKIFDPSLPVAHQVERKHSPSPVLNPSIKMYTSGNIEKANAVISNIMNFPYTIEHIEL